MLARYSLLIQSTIGHPLFCACCVLLAVVFCLLGAISHVSADPRIGDRHEWQEKRSSLDSYVASNAPHHSQASWYDASGQKQDSNGAMSETSPQPISKAQQEIDALWDKDPAVERQERERIAQRAALAQRQSLVEESAPISSSSMSWPKRSPGDDLTDSESKPKAALLAESIEKEQEDQLMRRQNGYASPRPNMVTGKRVLSYDDMSVACVCCLDR